MRMYAWVAPMVLVVTAAAVAKADDDRPAPSAAGYAPSLGAYPAARRVHEISVSKRSQTFGNSAAPGDPGAARGWGRTRPPSARRPRTQPRELP